MIYPRCVSDGSLSIWDVFVHIWDERSMSGYQDFEILEEE